MVTTIATITMNLEIPLDVTGEEIEEFIEYCLGLRATLKKSPLSDYDDLSEFTDGYLRVVHIYKEESE